MALDFSIVTPSHRQNYWLRLCVHSIADQQGVSVEQIIQDTGSAAEIQSELEAAGKVRLVVEKDKGMYDGLNRGFAKASGDVLAWLNCDEQYLPGALSRVRDYFNQHPDIDVVVGDAIVIDGASRPLCYRKAILPSPALIPSITLPFLSCATFFRRRVWESGIRFRDDYRLMSDSIIFREMMLRGFRWARLRQFISTFAFLGDNLGASGSMGQEFERWRKELGIHANGLRRGIGRFSVNARRVWEGALKPLDIAIEIYTLDSNAARKQITAKQLPGKWVAA